MEYISGQDYCNALALQGAGNEREARERIQRLEARIDVLERILRVQQVYEWSRLHNRPIEDFYDPER